MPNATRSPRAKRTSPSTEPSAPLPNPNAEPHAHYSAALEIIEEALGRDFVVRFDESVGARMADAADNALAEVDRKVDDRLDRLEATTFHLLQEAIATLRQFAQGDR